MKPVMRICLTAICVYGAAVHADALLIEGAKIYTQGPAGVIEMGNVLIRDGRIAAVGGSTPPDDAIRVLDGTGKHVTPGLINAYTHLGVIEIGMVEETVDVATEDVLFSASFNIASAINPYSTLFPHNLINGLTHAVTAPLSGHHIFAGSGAVIRLADPDSPLVSANAAVFASLGGAAAGLSGGSRAAAHARMRQAFVDALEYDRHRAAVRSGEWRELSLPLNDLDALLPVLKNQLPLVVSANRASDIRVLLKLKADFGFDLIVAGAAEAWRVAPDLAAAEVPVLLDPLANLPVSFDTLGARLDGPARLHRAGVILLFSGVNYLRTHAAYLVRQAAGNAVAYGLPHEEALSAMTINTARAFGFADQTGSIEVGKSADLVIWDGDPLELLTRPDQVIAKGELVPMVSRATRLRDRYRDLDAEQPFQYRK